MDQERASRDLRDAYLAQCVRGKRFVDLGGLFGSVGEKIDVVSGLGAQELAVVDPVPLGEAPWKDLEQRLERMGIERFPMLSASVVDPECADTSEPFEVGHWAGALHRHADPVASLAACRRFVTEFLVLSAYVAPERLSNRFGRLVLPSCGAVYLPALSEGEVAVLREFWRDVGNAGLAVLSSSGWLPTVRTLVTLCERAGYAVVASGYAFQNDAGNRWDNKVYTCLLQVLRNARQ